MAAGVAHMTLVVGHQAERIEQALGGLSLPIEVHTHHNPRYEQASLLSLWTARHALRAGDDVLLMDADVLYDRRLLDRLLCSGHRNCVALDRQAQLTEEAVKVAWRAGVPVGFGKRLPAELSWDVVGEAVGFFRLEPAAAEELARRCEQAVADEQAEVPYEQVLGEMIVGGPRRFGVADVTGLPWIEIDFSEDVARAEQVILPQLQG